MNTATSIFHIMVAFALLAHGLAKCERKRPGGNQTVKGARGFLRDHHSTGRGFLQ